MFLKVATLVVDLSSSGRSFHVCGPEWDCGRRHVLRTWYRVVAWCSRWSKLNADQVAVRLNSVLWQCL